MKILVYPHDLSIGGSQLNAIEIAAKLAERGHDVVVFGVPGPLTSRIEEFGLRFLVSPSPRRRPSRSVVRELRRIIDEEQIDIVHGYEWPPALESFLACRSGRSASAVATVMSMAVAPFLPRAMPLLVGTEQIAESERRSGRVNVSTLQPPIDLVENNPSRIDGVAQFRAKWSIPSEGLTLVTVSRLAHEMKLEGIMAAIDAVEQLVTDYCLTLVIVGDGPARGEVEAKAEQVNERLGRRVVVVAGEMMDPRAAYAIGEVVFGMGGSALKAMAFGKPLLVQGEKGFWRLLSEDTVSEFLWTGWYGVGRDPQTGTAAFIDEISPVLVDENLRERLGAFGRDLVERRFSLEAAADEQMESYRSASRVRNPRARDDVIDLVRSAARFAHYTVSRKVARMVGRASVDDFNSRPVLTTGPVRPPTVLP